jgi:flagellar biosynthesis GTPase FlhF
MINLWCATLAAYGQSTIVFLVYGARSDVAEQWRATLFKKNRSAVQSYKPNGNRRNGGYGCTKRQQRQRAAAAAQQQRQQQRAPRSSIVVTSGTKDGLSSQGSCDVEAPRAELLNERTQQQQHQQQQQQQQRQQEQQQQQQQQQLLQQRLQQQQKHTRFIQLKLEEQASLGKFMARCDVPLPPITPKTPELPNSQLFKAGTVASDADHDPDHDPEQQQPPPRYS